jgi:hypothetical protein
MKMMYKLSLLMSFAATAEMGCSNARLYKGEFSNNGSVQVNFCTTPAAAVSTKIKYLFVIDQSYNNQQNYYWNSNTDGPYADVNGGTDPTGGKRYDSLITFLNNAALNPSSSIYYSALFFNTNPIVPFKNFTGGGLSEDQLQESIWYSLNGALDVQNTAAYMSAQYTNIACPNAGPCDVQPQADGGWSDYSDTLTLVLNSIEQDLGNEQVLVDEGQPLEASSYVIFWVSSSFPYLPSGAQNTQALVNQVKTISALKTQQQYAPYIDSIIFNTGYYSTNSNYWSQQQTSTLLQNMAAVGQGTYVDFSTNDINYSKFSVPQSTQPFVLKDFWVHDASAVWWKGQLMLDSDNDGIPDLVEVQMGSNPNAYDSDQNGIGDGVEYNLFGSPCGGIPAGGTGTCSNATAVKSFLGVPNCGSPGTWPNIYPDSDNDYLNDCEEGLLGSNHSDFDSNVDWVPDQLEWLFNIPFLYGTNGLTADPANDGVSNYQKLKDLFPINTPISQIQAIPAAYEITQVSANTSQTCYQANVTNLATMSQNDVVRVYVMETQGYVGNLRHMRVLKQTEHMTGSSLIVNDGDLTP